MGKRAVSEIMAQTSELNTLNVPVCDAEFWLLILKMLDHTTGQMGNAWRKY